MSKKRRKTKTKVEWKRVIIKPINVKKGRKMDVISYISNLLHSAVRNRVSDIHFEPQDNGLRIRERIDGLLLEVDYLSKEVAPPIISRLKVMTNLDIGERRLPQDGSMVLEQKGDCIDVRISTIPLVHGEKVVLRLLYRTNEAITLDQLGITPLEEKAFQSLLRQNAGLLIVTGPTGSGKTTTLYAMLQALNQTHTNVVTLEDPVEFHIPGVNQVQIHSKVGLTFSKGLRSVL
jgi:type II secretory ATPase GspE/PulE/Tfp pilus assembly ATPase PilB-like protein